EIAREVRAAAVLAEHVDRREAGEIDAVEEQQRGLDAAVGQERLAAQLRQVSGGRGGGEQGVGHLSCPRVEWLAALTGASRHEEKCGRGGPSGASKMAGVYRLGGAPFQPTGGRT